MKVCTYIHRWRIVVDFQEDYRFDLGGPSTSWRMTARTIAFRDVNSPVSGPVAFVCGVVVRSPANAALGDGVDLSFCGRFWGLDG